MIETDSGNRQDLERKTQANSLERKIYTNNEAVDKSTAYFKGDQLAATVFVNKYALKDSKGNIYENSPDMMHRRLAKEFSRIESKYPNALSEEEVYGLIKDFNYIIPQGGPMSGIGNDLQIVSLSNCFVIGNDGPSDSYGGIMKIDQEQVQLMKRRGGVGHDLSHIRPKGSEVLNSALSSTGVVPFMERFSNSTREVAQDGRRGALMLSISIEHPDSEGFIDAKLEKGKVTGANISVKVDDEFMKAVLDKKPYFQQYPVGSDDPVYKKEINAGTLWDKIIHNAWKSAEPGVLFWDQIIRESIPDCYSDLGFKTVSTNPCGEIPLCPYDSCRLLAVNLYSYVDKPFTKEASFNFDLFKKHVNYAQRMNDDIIDMELEKIDSILNKIDMDPEDDELKRVERRLWQNVKRKAEEGRRTGTGITGEGDMLAALGLRYGTSEGTDFAVEIQKIFALEAYRTSVVMAQERGKFPIYESEREKDNPFIQRIKENDPELYEQMIKYGRRNISLLTIAPTGTTSMMSQTTSGIEPVFLPAYVRKRKVNPNDKNVKSVEYDEVGDAWEAYNVFHPKFETWLEVNGYNVNEVKGFDKEQLDEVVKLSPYYKATSNDVDWVEKVNMQGKMQKWVDHSISVTINLPKDASEDLVGKLYVKAWEAGCKGVTVYRDGSRSGVLSAEKKTLEDKVIKVEKPSMLKEEPHSKTYSIPTGEGKLYVTITGDENGFPQKVFMNLGPVGTSKSTSASVDGIRLSRYLEESVDANLIQVFKDYASAKSDNPIGLGPNRVDSIQHGFAIAWLYDNMVRGTISRESGMLEQKTHKVKNGNGNGSTKKLKEHDDSGLPACPACGSRNVLPPSGGCKYPTCKDCGNSTCG